jgi:hypothetical protein
MAPILQLTRRGLVWDESQAARLIDEFQRRQSLVLPGFIEPALLERVQRGVEQADFVEHHHELFVELSMRAHASLDLLVFLVNDERLFRLVERLAVSERVRTFIGRVYRNMPSRHSSIWHEDTLYDRKIGMSVNLTEGLFEGGKFEIRDAASGRVLNSIANVGRGDAILFGISEKLEHRVTPVEGTIPKTAFAGWFCSAPDYFAALRPNLPAQLRAAAPPQTTPASGS